LRRNSSPETDSTHLHEDGKAVIAFFFHSDFMPEIKIRFLQLVESAEASIVMTGFYKIMKSAH
jgi:hypothetical protein